MADIDIKQPAKINRNTAADGDFLWEKDFKVLYENDQALKNAIEQGTKELTPSSGINIDADKNITVNKGKGLKFNGNSLEVDIEGKGGADVTFEGNKIVVSGYNPTELINDVSELANSLDVFSESLKELKEEAITSADSMQPGTQYVYTTSGWVPIAGGGQQEISYWRPTYNSSTGKIEWEMRPSPSMVTPLPSDDLRGSNGENGQTPEFRVNETTNFWEWKYTDDPDVQASWHNTNTSATGPRGAAGETGAQGFSVELDSVKTVQGGKEITLKWGDPESPSTSAFVITSGDKGGKGDPGDKGTPGDDGYTPSVSADDITDVNGRGKKITFYWPEGPAGKSDTEFNIYHGYSPTMALRAVTDPQGQHTEGGIEFTINYLDKGTSAIGTIWNGNNGTATVNCEGTYITGNGTAGNVIRPTTETIDILQSVSGKVNKPDTSLKNMYLVLRTDTNGVPSGWCDFNDKIYSKTESDGRYMQKNTDSTLSGDGTTNSPLGIDTADLDDNKKYAFTTNGWDEIDDFVKKTGDTMTGPLVVSASSNNIVGLGKDAFQFGQTRYNSDDQVIGTNWMGVGQGTGGFLKYVAGGTSADHEGTNGKVQINYSVDNGRGKIEVDASYNGTTSKTQVINATTASVNGMSTSAIDSNNMSGPNYMIAKNADGQFVIGAAVYNCQGNLPGTLAPNTYYFVY